MAISFVNDPLIATIEAEADQSQTVLVFGVDSNRALVLSGDRMMWYDLGFLRFTLTEGTEEAGPAEAEE